MRAAVIAVSNSSGLPELDAVPKEARDQVNLLNSAGWSVRLITGDDATADGMLRLAAEGPFELVLVGCHSSERGFALTDGIFSAPDLGQWVASVSAREVVLNSCNSVIVAPIIQRYANCAVVATCDADGVDDEDAARAVIYLLRSFLRSGNMQEAARTTQGAIEYRYYARTPTPRRGMWPNPSGEYMETLEMVRRLERALVGDPVNGMPGLYRELDALNNKLMALAESESNWINNHEHRILGLESRQAASVSLRLVLTTVAVVSVIALVLALSLSRLIGGG